MDIPEVRALTMRNELLRLIKDTGLPLCLFGTVTAVSAPNASVRLDGDTESTVCSDMVGCSVDDRCIVANIKNTAIVIAAIGGTDTSGKADVSHTHAASDVTSGSFGVARGGTGRNTLTSGSYLIGNGTSAVSLKTPAQVLSDIGAAASSHNHAAGDINSGTLGVARGGTGRGTFTSGNYLIGNGTSGINSKSPSDVLSDIGAAAENHTHSTYVEKAGDTMTGQLNVQTREGIIANSSGFGSVQFRTSQHNIDVMRMYAGTDSNGDALVLHSAGLVIVGGGESPGNLYTELVTNGSWSNGTEQMVVGSDGSVWVMPNCQTVADRKVWQFTTGAELVGPNEGNVCPNGSNGQIYITSGPTATDSKKMQIALSGANSYPQFRLYDGSAWGSWTNLSAAGHTHNYLPLSGGTLTGNVNRKNTSMDTAAATIASQVYSIIGFTDANDRYISYLQASEAQDGTSIFDVAVRRYNSGNQTNYVRMRMNKSSVASVEFSHPAAWRDGLGIAPVELYNHTSTGIGTAVSLSDSVANYTRVKVYVKDNNGKFCGCQEFYGLATSSVFELSAIEASANGSTIIRKTLYTVSSNGKTLTPSNGGYVQMTTTATSGTSNTMTVTGTANGTNYLRVYRVEGYGY